MLCWSVIELQALENVRAGSRSVQSNWRTIWKDPAFLLLGIYYNTYMCAEWPIFKDIRYSDAYCSERTEIVSILSMGDGLRKVTKRDAWVAQLVKPLPLAQVMIPESWDRVSHWAPCSVGILLLSLPLTATLPACALSLSLSLWQINK